VPTSISCVNVFLNSKSERPLHLTANRRGGELHSMSRNCRLHRCAPISLEREKRAALDFVPLVIAVIASRGLKMKPKSSGGMDRITTQPITQTFAPLEKLNAVSQLRARRREARSSAGSCSSWFCKLR
jgi:hypothetical protein